MKRFYFGLVCAIFVSMVCAVVLPPELVAATPFSLVAAMFVAKLLEEGIWRRYEKKQQGPSTRHSVNPIPSAVTEIQKVLAQHAENAPLSKESERLVQETSFSAEDYARISAQSNKPATAKKSSKTSRRR